MISLVLECPECSSRFRFENESDQLPEKIGCPQCGSSKEYWTFMAVLFCSQCNTKLKAPLSIIDSTALGCPRCNAPLDCNYNTASSEEKIENENRSQMMLGGEIFDKYRIIRLLGKGGMAEVYLAEHLLLKQLCALKIMLDTTAAKDPVYVKRFLREAKLSHKLNHPNIVKMHEVGSDTKTGYFFIAMEYVEGETLTEIMHTQKLSEEYLKILLHSMAGALKCLADAGVVHRDIKPSNIMLDKNGIFKLMDLGIAKTDSNRMAGEMTLTMEQTAIGTPSYASPEQCRSSHNVDTRSDIYSLGATLYHAASGKLPFDGATPVEIILKVIQSSPESLSSLRPDLSDNFIDLVEMMMKKSPEERPSSPEELTALLPLSGKAPEIKMKKISRQKNKEKSSSSAFSKVLKYGFVLLLLLVIVINVRYIYDYYQNKQTSETPARVKQSVPAVRRSVEHKVIVPKAPVKKTSEVTPIATPAHKPENKSEIKPFIPTPPTPVVKSAAPQTQSSDTERKELQGSLSWTKNTPDFTLKTDSTKNNSIKETLDEQVENSRRRYYDFQKDTRELERDQHETLAKLTVYQRGQYRLLLSYRKTLVLHWNKYLTFLANRNQKIDFVKKRSYDAKINREFQEVVREYTRKRKNWGISRSDYEYRDKFAKMLQNNNLDPNIKVVDSTYPEYSGNLLLAIASGRIYGNEKLMEILISRGVDPSVLDSHRHRISYILPLIPYGGLPKKRRNEAFNYILANNHTKAEEYARKLFMDGVKPTADHLSQAVLMKNKSLVMFILATGLDPNKRDSNSETALFKSYRIADGEDIRELLLAAGANPDIRNTQGKKASDYADVEKFFIHWAKKDYAACEAMLKDGFNVNMKLPNGLTLLQDACKKFDYDTVKLLLKYHADPNLSTFGHQPAINYAVNELYRTPELRKNIDENLSLIKELINAGASLNNITHAWLHNLLYTFISVIDITKSDEAADVLAQLIRKSKNINYSSFQIIQSSIHSRKHITGFDRLKKAVDEIDPQ